MEFYINVNIQIKSRKHRKYDQADASACVALVGTYGAPNGCIGHKRPKDYEYGETTRSA